MKKLFAVYLRVRQKNSSGTEEDRYRRKSTAVLRERNTSTGPAADRKTLDAKLRREHRTSCLKEQLLLPASLGDFQTGGGCVLSALSGHPEIPLQDAGTFLHVVASKPLLSWSLCLSGWSSFQATCLFIVIVSLSLLSSSLCLGGAHLGRPPLAHTPGVIRCHRSAWASI